MSSPLKILQVVSGRDVNGALVYCRLLSERLAERGHEVTLLCREGAWIARQTMPGVRVLESSLDRWPLKELRRIRGLIADQGIRIVHSHMSRAHNFAAMLRQMAPIQSVATAHAQYLQLHWRFHDLVLANSHSTAAFHRRFNRVPEARLKTIYCFADLQRFLTARSDRRSWYRRELHAPPERLLIGVIGEVVKRKGHRFLVEALPQILRMVPDSKLVFIGRFHRNDACTRQLRKLQQQLKLFRRIHWLGRRENVHEYLQAMDVCVVPSLVEPLGLVAVEAQAASIPVVSTSVGGLPEIVVAGKTGLIVPPRNPAALAEAVLRLHGDPRLKSKLVAAGRESARQQFDPELLTELVIKAYRGLNEKSAARN